MDILSLGRDAWITGVVLLLILATLVATSIPGDVVMLGGLTVLMVAGVLTPKEALSGLSNEGMVTVGVLFVVVAGLQQTGCMTRVAARVFGRPKGVRDAQLRLMLPVAALSAFMNNTPLVAMMLPVVNEWARKFGISASKVMMPLSFATILGGLCTLIGTSTNVVAAGLLRERIDSGAIAGEPLAMFTMSVVGVPVAPLKARFACPAR